MDQVLGEIGASVWIIGKQKHEPYRKTVKPVSDIGDIDEIQSKLRCLMTMWIKCRNN